MPGPMCSCQCKICRVPGSSHCRAHPGCCVPVATSRGFAGRDERVVAGALRELKAGSGSHSPSVAEFERAMPGLVKVDACFLSNPYATNVVMSRLHAIDRPRLERMVSHYPSQGPAIASLVADHVGVPADQVCVANGACEVIHALLARSRGPLLINLPTFSAYYEFADAPLITHQLDAAEDFRVDLDELDSLVKRYAPDTVVIINPNNPDGGLLEHASLVNFIERLTGRVRQVIVDESFGAFTTEDTPTTLAPLVAELPHLVVVNSLSKSHGIAGLRLGYAIMAPLRARQVRAASLWNINALAEWFCGLLSDRDYLRAYEHARRRYIRETRRLFDALAALPSVKALPSAANFALLELDHPADEIATALLARHGVYVRDCADKWGLEGGRYLRIAARTAEENRLTHAALADVLAAPAHRNLGAAA